MLYMKELKSRNVLFPEDNGFAIEIIKEIPYTNEILFSPFEYHIFMWFLRISSDFKVRILFNPAHFFSNASMRFLNSSINSC